MQIVSFHNLLSHEVKVLAKDVLQYEYCKAVESFHDIQDSCGWEPDNHDCTAAVSRRILRTANIPSLIENGLGLDHGQLHPSLAQLIFYWALGLLELCLPNSGQSPEYFEYINLEIKKVVMVLQCPFDRWTTRLYAKATLLKIADELGLGIEYDQTSHLWAYSNAFMTETRPVRAGKLLLPDYVETTGNH